MILCLLNNLLPDDYNNLPNNAEIDWQSPLIINGKPPTLDQCIAYAGNYGKITYVEKSLRRLQSILKSVYSELLNIKILPIKSDPISPDGDGDGILDKSNYWDGINERFKKMSPLHEDSLETVYSEKIKTSSNDVIHIEIKKNNIIFYISSEFIIDESVSVSEETLTATPSNPPIKSDKIIRVNHEQAEPKPRPIFCLQAH